MGNSLYTRHSASAAHSLQIWLCSVVMHSVNLFRIFGSNEVNIRHCNEGVRMGKTQTFCVHLAFWKISHWMDLTPVHCLVFV